MAKAVKHNTIPFDREAFLARQVKRRGFAKAYIERGHEYALLREVLAARVRSGLTQEAVAKRMGTTKSAISRLEGTGAHAPSVATLERYAAAVGHRLEIRLVPEAQNEVVPRRPKGGAKKGEAEPRIVQGTTVPTRLMHVLRQIRAEYVDHQRQGQMPRDSGELAKFDKVLDDLRMAGPFWAKLSSGEYDDVILTGEQIASLDQVSKDFDKGFSKLKAGIAKKRKARLARQA